MSLTQFSVQEMGNDRHYARKVAVEHDERKWPQRCNNLMTSNGDIHSDMYTNCSATCTRLKRYMSTPHYDLDFIASLTIID